MGNLEVHVEANCWIKYHYNKDGIIVFDNISRHRFKGLDKQIQIPRSMTFQEIANYIFDQKQKPSFCPTK